MQIEDYLYQKKLHEPLAEAKPTGMKAEDWTLLVRQALGVVRLSLAKNVAYHVVNEKTTYGLIKALSNMYDKHSASNKVFLIRQLVNTKTKEGASIADHVNEFNSILSRLMYVDIKFHDEVQVLLLHSSLPESWSGTVTIGSKSRHRAEARSKTECSKPVASKYKEVHMAISDYDDALVCCVENMIEDHIMDSSASFHATFFKEELESFRLRSSKLDEEGYHIGFEGQQWKVTRGSLVVACGNKHGSMYMVEVDLATMLPLSMIAAGRDVTFNEDSLYGAKAATDYSNLTKLNQKDQVVLEDTPKNLANNSIVAEHRVSLKITQSLSGSSDTVRSPKTVRASRIVEDHMKKTLKTKHPSMREASKLHMYQGPAKSPRLWLVLSVIASGDLHPEQLDVKTTILHGDLDEDIYMAQPEGFQSAGKEENLICKLKKILYGLKQAPRQWYLKFDNFMQRAGYKRCVMDHCCYLKKVGSSFIILLLYVDDMFVI
nr:retrovirus-related Pol polyprotein from transposon TNT 1-94 [Tanacetum cinerariifolium]